ncbi:MAG: hypothetical protein IPK16_03675 [Anaerolineales bacterium]|nr:hypothetical protein [Anaerolineales bacterium]
MDRYTIIDSHIATYQVGVFDFDFTKNVENPDGSGYIGEYGIGISERHGILNNNLDQVVAIEVYLFDKSDENNLSTTTRALLSEYAHDNLYKYFEQEKPITLQKTTPPFQLEGRRLLLDCTVKDVKYTRDGIFQSVSVDLKLMQKN